MNKTIYTLLLLLCSLFFGMGKASANAGNLSPVIACPGNLLTNPDFDMQLSGWQNPTDGYIVVSPTGDNIATMCAIFAPGQLYQQKSAIAGSSYTFTANAKNEGDSPSELYMLFLDANGQPLNTEYILFFDNVYQDYTITSVAPAGTATIEVGFALILGPTCVFSTSTCLTGPTTSATLPCQPDLLPPVLSNCPSNINLQSTTASGASTVTWVAPTVFDSCTATTLVSNFHPGDMFQVGSSTVIYTASDAAGNTAGCSFQVSITAAPQPCNPDVVAPTILGCPMPIVASTNANTATVNWQAPTALDSCGAVTIVGSHIPGTDFPIGLQVITYTATDASGNTATCQFNVLVQGINPCLPDSTRPVFLSCPTNIQSTTTDSAALALWLAPTTFDQCGPTTIQASHTSGTLFPVGVTTVQYNVFDQAQNSNSCTFTVAVEKITNPCLPDSVAPVILNCPANLTVTTTTLAGVATQWLTPSATDSCSSVSLTSNFQPGAVFGLGTATVVYTAVDGGGNFSTCSFSVTVVPFSPCAPDMIAPTLSACPQNISLTTTDLNASATWADPIGYDSCSTVVLTSTYPSGYFFPIGVRTVTYTAKDDAGNTAKCSFTVTVEQIQSACFPDLTPPTIIGCPANISLSTTLGAAVANWTPPVATDSCSIASLSANFNSGTSFSVGTKTVTYTARDAANNSAQCSFTVTVTALVNPCFPDKNAPVIKGCPGNINVTTTTNNKVVTWVAPTTFDSCSQVTLTSNYASGAVFPIGTRTVTYTARDASFNTSSCAFNVTVVKVIDPCSPDITAPKITGCPSNISVNAAPGATSAIVQWTKPTPIDSCGPSTLTANYQPGAIFPVGVRTVTYTARDASNNSARCSFKVTVAATTSPCFPDKTAPKFTGCPASMTVTTTATATTAAATWTAPIATDSCSSVTVTSNYQPGAVFAVGTKTVQYIARDAAGNSATCTFNVTVVRPVNPCSPDVTAPIITGCPANVSVSTTTTTKVVQWVAPTAKDSCTTATVTSTHSPGATFGVGTTIVKYTAKDAANNTRTCQFTVTVTSTATLRPDLTVANLTTANTSIPNGSNIAFKADVRNIGNANVTALFSTRGYISTDTIVSTNDLQVGYVAIGSLNAGSTLNQISFSGSIPGTVAPGSYYLLVKADPINVITESNENNNTISRPITITSSTVVGGKPDLKVTITADKSTVAQQGAVIYTVTLLNEGNAPLTAATVKIGVCGTNLFTFNQTSKLIYGATSFVPSSGSYNLQSQVWTVSYLGAGKSATIKLPMVNLSTTALKVAAWVSTQSPADFDSQPSTSAPANCTPAQDDEAVATINANAPLVSNGNNTVTNTPAFEPEAYQLYPNPAHEVVYVVVPPVAEAATVTIFNQVGTQMSETQKIFLAKEDNTVLQIPVTDFANGVYFIRIESEGTRAITKKLMVARPE
jgi:hypothetical protein